MKYIMKELLHFKSKFVCTYTNVLNVSTFLCNSSIIKMIISAIQMKSRICARSELGYSL